MITNERSSSFQGMHEADIQKIEQLVKTLERVQSLTEAEHVKTFVRSPTVYHFYIEIFKPAFLQIEILCWGTDIGTDEQNQIFHAFNTDLLLSKDQLDDIEEKLKTRTTPDQTEKIMSILRKVTTDNPLQFGDGLVDIKSRRISEDINEH